MFYVPRRGTGTASARWGVLLDRALAVMPAEYAAEVADHLVAEITRAGVALNVLARQANTDEELPGDKELDAGLLELEALLPRVAG
jgi:hypothetical protein